MGKITTLNNAKAGLLGAICLLTPVFSQAELALAVQPNTPKADDHAFYQSFAESLTELIGEDVVYVPERSWSKFRKKLVANEYDLLISEPHITAIMSLTLSNGGLDYNVLASVPDQVTYKVVTTKDSGLSDLSSLNGKHVCTPISPGLAAVAFLNKYKDDPVNPPLVVESKKGVERAYQSMLKNRCQAMVMTSLEFEKLKLTAEDMVTIYETKPYPGWALNFSPTQPDERRQLITDMMLAMDEPAVQNLYQALSTQAGGFVKKDKDEYIDYNILPGVVWGW